MVTAKAAKSISRKERRDRKEFNQIDFCPQITQINADFARWLAVFVH